MFRSRKLSITSGGCYRLGQLLRNVIACLWVVGLGVSALPVSAHGGGTPRIVDEAAGPYRIFAWTQPEPLRVGEIHLSIGVVKAQAGGRQAADALDEPVTDATVTVSLLPLTEGASPISAPAMLQEQLGSYYYEADVTLPTPGDWRFTIEVSGDMGVSSAAFVGEVRAAREINWTLLSAAGVLLFCLLGLIGVWNRMQARDSTK